MEKKKKNKDSACKGASSAEHCHFNSPMKSLENWNVLLWFSPVTLVLFKIWFSSLTELVKCRCVHYLFSLHEFITCSSNPWSISVFSAERMSRSQGKRIASEEAAAKQPDKVMLLSRDNQYLPKEILSPSSQPFFFLFNVVWDHP